MALSTPERNRYFYGKLLDVEQLEKEQHYFNHKRWLLNRLIAGTGVVCGLNIVSGESGEVVIQPGVAIDALGREIVVVDQHAFDPSLLTDDGGNPTGERIEHDEVEICLAYGETRVDPVPVLVPDCDTPDGCAHSTIREEYRVLVRRPADSPEPVECGLAEFPLPVGGELEEQLCARIRRTCPQEPESSSGACVPLGRVTLPMSDAESIHACDGVQPVLNNALLYELLLCLADRVTAIAQGPILRYAFGDNQVATVESALAEPLGVEIIDGEGNPIAGVTVEFEVMRGGGSLTLGVERETDAVSPHDRENYSLSVKTKDDGRASVLWTLGPEANSQQVMARAVGTSSTVTFHATATET